jgi:hypothetical protein
MSNGVEGAFAVRWDGTSWTLLHPRTPSNATVLYGVSCASARACTAVGNIGAERWNGSRWRIQRAYARPSLQASATLAGVSCPIRRRCTAVGSYAPPGAREIRTLAEQWNAGQLTTGDTVPAGAAILGKEDPAPSLAP